MLWIVKVKSDQGRMKKRWLEVVEGNLEGRDVNKEKASELKTYLHSPPTL